jgi:PAS domain S-box-containing protein
MVGENFPSASSSLPADAVFQAGDLLDAGVLTADTALNVTGWNRWMEAATGWSAADVIGRSLFELFPELPGSRSEGALRRAMAGETVVMSHRFHQYLLPLDAPAGYAAFGRMQQNSRVAPITSANGVEGILVLIQNVTERVAREAELRAAIETAEAASSAKSDFMAALSHELRTPLGAIMGYADLLEGEIVGPLLDTQKEYARRMKAGAMHLLTIIEEILAFSRSEAGREDVTLEEADLSEVVRQAISLVAPQAAAKGLEMRFTAPEGGPTVRSDPGKIRQILINLLGNAVKFSEAGPVEIRVWEEPATAYVEVCDRGAGILPQDLPRVFEPFTQLEQRHAQRGTGLGLPVSRNLARLLGGDLAARSTVGVGSCFTLRLPLEGPGGPRPPR